MKDNAIKLDTDRYLFLDVLKVIALIFMPIIHIFSFVVQQEIFSGGLELVELHECILYYFTPGIFLFCMGCGLVLSRHNEAIDLYKRGKQLLLIGLLLNAFRGALLFSILGSVFDESYYREAAGWLWGSDILYFDGLFFLILALWKKLNMSDMMLFGLAIILSIISGVFVMRPTSYHTIDLLLGNIIHIDENSFFPIVSWMIWPVLGYLFFKKYLNEKNKEKYVLNVGIISLVVFIACIIFLFMTKTFKERYILWGVDFIIDIPTTILILSVEGVYICIVYFLVKYIRNQKIIHLISWISKKVNTIYCVHWVIILWSCYIYLFTINKNVQNIIVLYIIGIAVFILSAIIAKLIECKKR